MVKNIGKLQDNEYVVCCECCNSIIVYNIEDPVISWDYFQSTGIVKPYILYPECGMRITTLEGEWEKNDDDISYPLYKYEEVPAPFIERVEKKIMNKEKGLMIFGHKTFLDFL